MIETSDKTLTLAELQQRAIELQQAIEEAARAMTLAIDLRIAVQERIKYLEISS